MQRTIKIGQLEILTPISYYWVVKGKIPLKLANELYQLDEEKKIRVDGNCTAPKPELPWVRYYCPKTKKKLISFTEFQETKNQANKLSKIFKEKVLLYLLEFLPVKDVTIGEGFVELYHIDSNEALEIFLKKCGEYGLLTN
jgi:hypothetical protein